MYWQSSLGLASLPKYGRLSSALFVSAHSWRVLLCLTKAHHGVKPTQINCGLFRRFCCVTSLGLINTTSATLFFIHCTGPVWWDPLHPPQPDCILEVYAEHLRPADRLSLQPRVHGESQGAHQRADLGAGRRRRHQHAVPASIHLVRCKAGEQQRHAGNQTTALYQKRIEVLFSCRNSEQSKCLWKLSDISEKSENEGKLDFLFVFLSDKNIYF